MPPSTRAISLLLATFANVKDEQKTEIAGQSAAPAQDTLSGKRCIVAILADPKKMSGSAPPRPAEAALAAAIEQAGCTRVAHLTSDEATEPANLAACDVLFLCGQSLSLRSGDAKEVWTSNVTATRNACEAAERAGVKRIVLLGSILSLGHSPDGSPVDAATPYLSDDKRTLLERSLLRQEMEVWQMAERGLEVSVVCGGIVWGSCEWVRHIDPVKNTRLLTTPAAMAEALVRAASDAMVGKRLICTGLAEDLVQSMVWQKPSVAERLFGQTARAMKILGRLGIYASDFAPAEK